MTTSSAFTYQDINELATPSARLGGGERLLGMLQAKLTVDTLSLKELKVDRLIKALEKQTPIHGKLNWGKISNVFWRWSMGAGQLLFAGRKWPAGRLLGNPAIGHAS